MYILGIFIQLQLFIKVTSKFADPGRAEKCWFHGSWGGSYNRFSLTGLALPHLHQDGASIGSEETGLLPRTRSASGVK